MTQRPDRVLSVVLTPEEYDHVDGFAGRYGMSPAEFMRRLVRNVAAVGDAFQITSLPRPEAP